MQNKKVGIGLITSGGTVKAEGLLKYKKLLELKQVVPGGYCLNLRNKYSDFVNFNITFPSLLDQDIEIGAIKKFLENHLEIFNIEFFDSLFSLRASDANYKIAVFFVEQSNFMTLDESYNNLITEFVFIPDLNDLFDAYNNKLLKTPVGFAAKSTYGFHATPNEKTNINIFSGEADYTSGGIDPLNPPDLGIVLVFTDSLKFSQKIEIPDPDSTPEMPKPNLKYQEIEEIKKFSPDEIKETTLHELGHALGLDHHGTSFPLVEYYQGNDCWAPIMGSSDPFGLNQNFYWSDGSYLSASKPNQDDIFIISRNVSLIKLPDSHPVLNGPKQWNKINENITLLEDENKKIISKNIRLVGSSDIFLKQLGDLEISTIEGMVGFPGDSDILKLVLKAGTYNIGEIGESSSYANQLHAGLKIIKSISEVSKQTKKIDEPKRFPETDQEEFDCEPVNNFPKVYPENCKYGCSAITIPEEKYIEREPVDCGETLAFYGIGLERSLNFTIEKTSLIYLKVYGDKQEDQQTTGFSSYGSVGKYYIIIKKITEDMPEGIQNLFLILTGEPPPNCYATEKIKCILNGEAEDRIFFTQDPSDYKPPSGLNPTDKPNVRKYNIVINGKLIEIPILLMGPGYTELEDIEEQEDKEIFCVQRSGANFFQEFVVAPEWDY